jgi:hypothetical protein
MNEVRRGADLEMSRRVQDGLRARIGEMAAVTPALAALIRGNFQTEKRMRLELLDLTNDADMARWQKLRNDSEKYEIISDKPSHQKGDHRTAIMYYELGEDLPMIKSKRELRAEDGY